LTPPPATLRRVDLYAALAASEPLRATPWSPALVVGGLHPAEVEWVCQAREWVPRMATQLLRTQRELQEERRAKLALEGELAILRAELAVHRAAA
jgi:hypothetical protein